jgi:hypothetical protein
MPAAIRGQRHRAVEGVDLPHEMSLADAPDRRVARHCADPAEGVRDQTGPTPSRAAASAASVPAWPPPTTMTP